MDDSVIINLKKDWVATMATVSGIMLAICVGFLSFIGSSNTQQLSSNITPVLCLWIVVACICLMRCCWLCISTIGAIIIAADLMLRNRPADALKAQEAQISSKALRAKNWLLMALASLVGTSAIFLFGLAQQHGLFDIIRCDPK